MGYKAAVQVLKQAEILKERVNKPSDLLEDAEAWTNQQKLQTIYHQVLILDLEYALDKKVEQDLWNIGFKNHITHLQNLTRDKKNPRRSDFQALLTWALESASGFYLTLLQELCDTFDINLPFRRKGHLYGQAETLNEQVNQPQRTSCSYICQYCLVHLGDIARYRNQRRQAESFYKQAILVSPHSGHPYNQLALLQASQGDKLSTVFYYVRGICVKNPFPGATANLMNVLSSAIDKESDTEKIQTKMTVSEFVQLFLCTHGYFHTLTGLDKSKLNVKSLNAVMTALVATQSFKLEELVKITTINFYSLKHLAGKEADLTQDELQAKELILELIAGSLNAFLMPVYTLKLDDSLFEYCALPAVKLMTWFLRNESEVLKCRVFKERLQIWPSLCKLVNAVQDKLKLVNSNKYNKLALKEDRYLAGFIIFEQNLKDLNLKEDSGVDISVQNKVRMKQIVDFVDWLSECDFNGTKLVEKKETNGVLNFEAVTSQPDPTNDLLEEMKSLTISVASQESKLNEKKAGILKPQGSLEKSREEREGKKSGTTSIQSISEPQKSAVMIADASVKTKRSKQNVALQSIFKKMEETNKQVKFDVEETTEKDKSVKFNNSSAQSPQQQQQPPANMTNRNQPFPQNAQNAGLRTQTFNQNHPAFPGMTPQQQNPTTSQPPTDYLMSLRNLGKTGEQQQSASLMPQFAKNSLYTNLQPPNSQIKVPNYPPPNFNVPPPQFNTWNLRGGDDSQVPPHPPAAWVWNQQQPQQPQQRDGNTSQQQQQHQLLFNPMHSAFHAVIPQQNQNYQPQQSQPPPQQSSNNFPPTLSFPHQNLSLMGFNFTPFQHSQQLAPPPQQQQYYQTKTGQLAGEGEERMEPQHDIFPPPWAARQAPVSNIGAGDDGSSQSNMSMRQAMLKEAINVTGNGGGGHHRYSRTRMLQEPMETPGYSLFNNSWTPNLPGSLGGLKMTNEGQDGPGSAGPSNVPQHSLFGGQRGPQSLAQLLEHQQRNQMGGPPHTPH